MNLRILAPPLLRGPVVRPGVLGGPEVEVPQILGRPPTVALRFPTASLIEPRSFAIDKSGVPNLQDDSSVLAAPCEYRNPLSRDGAVAGAVTPVRDSVLLLSTPRVRRRESRPLVVLARNWRFSKCLSGKEWQPEEQKADCSGMPLVQARSFGGTGTISPLRSSAG